MKSFSKFVFLAFFSSFLFLSFSNKQELDGSIHGYILPKFSKPEIQVALPKSKNPNDTLYKKITPNAEGFFEIKNLSAGEYHFIFSAKEDGFKKMTKTYRVESGKATDAGRIFLERTH